jgi:hypothetical protein
MKPFLTGLALTGAFAIIPTETSSAQNNSDILRIASCVTQSMNAVRREFVPPIESSQPKILRQEFNQNTVTLSVSQLSFPNRIRFSVIDSQGVSSTDLSRSLIRRQITIDAKKSDSSLRDSVSLNMANNFARCMNGQNLSNDISPVAQYFNTVKPDLMRMRIVLN